MPVEATPLFRPEVLRPRLAAFTLPESSAEWQRTLRRWSELLSSAGGRAKKERELLPDFVSEVFQDILGYTSAVSGGDEGRYTLSRERLVEFSGKYADAVLGELGGSAPRYVVAVEGKGPMDPLERPHAGRKLSAVDQGYQYAINLPADWIVVTNLRELRLYHKGSTQRSYERFDVGEMAWDERELRRFVFVLGAERVVPRTGAGHLHELLTASEKAGEAVTQRFYAEYARMRRDVFGALCVDNPDVPPETVLTATQKLLDRVLFIAFCEDRGLLPLETLAKAYTHADPYNPRPVWENFRGLFLAIDQGREQLNIPRYNGGLFAEDPVLDGLVVRDAVCREFNRLGEYNYSNAAEVDDGRAGHVVDVEILGHIFEQSITDLEQLHARIRADGALAAAASPVSKRKREGAFYTPAFVTRYIVGEALRPVLAERWERLRTAHAERASGTAVRVLADPAVYDLAALNDPQRTALVRFWEGWLEELQTVRVVDPACGSGAFLIEAFDQLYLEYQKAVEHLFALERGQARVFDPDRTILQSNLYGVDLNEEAIQIARLSVWIKTAQRGKVLTDLDHNIRPGNSVVADPEVDARAFDWRGAFPEVFAAGGFDVVIGNPPYVRAELFTALKPYLEQHYRTYHGSADLYTYFYELGLRLLRPGGLLAYIVTNKWLKSSYGKPLREFFAKEAVLEQIIDFGHAPIFPDADVFPAILVAKRPAANETVSRDHLTSVTVFPREELGRIDIGDYVRDHGYALAAAGFSAESWSLARGSVEAVMEKIRNAGIPLREFVGDSPYYGIKTGFNTAFLIDTPTRNALVAEAPSAVEMIRPYLRGQDVDRWMPEWDDWWMIVMRSSDNFPWPWASMAADEAEAEFRATYPSLHQHFKRLEEKLRARRDQGRNWWELRTCDYYSGFEQSKIVYQVIQFHPSYCLDQKGYYLNDKGFFVPSSDLYLLAVLNSPLMWWHNWRYLPHMKDDALNPAGYRMVTLPIAPPSNAIRDAVEPKVKRLITTAQGRQRASMDLLDWLRTEFGVDEPGNKLRAPHLLDSDAFVAEVKKHRKERALTAAELKRLREEYLRSIPPLIEEVREAETLEDEISDAVNAAYGLTAEDVALMWETAPPRMPGRPPQSRASAA